MQLCGLRQTKVARNRSVRCQESVTGGLRGRGVASGGGVRVAQGGLLDSSPRVVRASCLSEQLADFGTRGVEGRSDAGGLAVVVAERSCRFTSWKFINGAQARCLAAVGLVSSSSSCSKRPRRRERRRWWPQPPRMRPALNESSAYAAEKLRSCGVACPPGRHRAASTSLFTGRGCVTRQRQGQDRRRCVTSAPPGSAAPRVPPDQLDMRVILSGPSTL